MSEKQETQELISKYRKRLEEQTHLVFALVGKLGGKVTLSIDDFNAFPEMNTVNANVEEDGSLTLELSLYEEQSVIA
jgi:hypothetical protein